ncbi:MAG: hypothetical protein J6Y62_03090 [Clostridia bacterium]|nr:hypothetical protein [Clostridia bacterium]
MTSQNKWNKLKNSHFVAGAAKEKAQTMKRDLFFTSARRRLEKAEAAKEAAEV